MPYGKFIEKSGRVSVMSTGRPPPLPAEVLEWGLIYPLERLLFHSFSHPSRKLHTHTKILFVGILLVHRFQLGLLVPIPFSPLQNRRHCPGALQRVRVGQSTHSPQILDLHGKQRRTLRIGKRKVRGGGVESTRSHTYTHVHSRTRHSLRGL
jgi:hypothetical protein